MQGCHPWEVMRLQQKPGSKATPSALIENRAGLKSCPIPTVARVQTPFSLTASRKHESIIALVGWTSPRRQCSLRSTGGKGQWKEEGWAGTGKVCCPWTIARKYFEGMGESRVWFWVSLLEGVPQQKDRDDLGQQEWSGKVERLLKRRRSTKSKEVSPDGWSG